MIHEESLLSEEFSQESAIMREENRIVSAITAFHLIQEGRYSDAEIFRQSFLEIKDLSAKDLAKGLGCYFLEDQRNCEEKGDVAQRMLNVAKVLAGDPASIDKSKAQECTTVLTELLYAITTKP